MPDPTTPVPEAPLAGRAEEIPPLPAVVVSNAGVVFTAPDGTQQAIALAKLIESSAESPNAAIGLLLYGVIIQLSAVDQSMRKMAVVAETTLEHALKAPNNAADAINQAREALETFIPKSVLDGLFAEAAKHGAEFSTRPDLRTKPDGAAESSSDSVIPLGASA